MQCGIPQANTPGGQTRGFHHCIGLSAEPAFKTFRPRAALGGVYSK